MSDEAELLEALRDLRDELRQIRGLLEETQETFASGVDRIVQEIHELGARIEPL